MWPAKINIILSNGAATKELIMALKVRIHTCTILEALRV